MPRWGERSKRATRRRPPIPVTPGRTARFALDHPEKLIDYAYRAVHEMTVKAKAIVDAFYGSAPKHSYWNGCSTGGRQALMEAQRYPADYDGIIAGAAANPKTHLDAWRIWMSQAMFKDPASFIPASKYPVIHQAVLKACDALDGLSDGLIDDPTRCHFDPGRPRVHGRRRTGLSDRRAGGRRAGRDEARGSIGAPAQRSFPASRRAPS